MLAMIQEKGNTFFPYLFICDRMKSSTATMDIIVEVSQKVKNRSI